MNVDSVNAFWSDDPLRRQRFICENLRDVMHDFPSLILAGKADLTEDPEARHERPKHRILHENILLACSMAFDGYHFNWKTKNYTGARHPYSRIEDDTGDRQYHYTVARLEAVSGLVSENQLLFIRDCLRMLFYGDRKTLGSVICDLCDESASSESGFDWKSARAKIEQIFPHGCNYILNRGEIERLVSSRWKSEILTIILSTPQFGQCCNIRAMTEGLVQTGSMEGEFYSFPSGMAQIAEMPFHPWALEAFHSWCKLQALSDSCFNEMSQLEKEWNQEPDVHLNFNLPYAGGWQFNEFLTSVPSADRRDLKILILGTAMLIHAAQSRPIRNNHFTISRRDILKLVAGEPLVGSSEEGETLYFALDGSASTWFRRVAPLVECGGFDLKDIRPSFSYSWIASFFNKLDYQKEDIQKCFFKNGEFWSNRRLSI